MTNEISKRSKIVISNYTKKTVIAFIICMIALLVNLFVPNELAESLSSALLIFAVLFFATYFIMLVSQIKSFKGLKKNRISYKRLEDVEKQLRNPSTVCLGKSNVYFTESYLLNLRGSFNVIPYEDIVWIYKRRSVYHKGFRDIELKNCLVAFTLDGEEYEIANTVKKGYPKDIHDQIITICHKKNPYIRFGNSRETLEYALGIKNKINDYKKANIDPRNKLRPEIENMEHTPL